ncbi:MAG: hypothetical protein JSV19_06655 [Phycisphaerales bacterium]|nr:MAG: hypothetical protein JSV19_06655 [Phycisphaerales bacterium]
MNQRIRSALAAACPALVITSGCYPFGGGDEPRTMTVVTPLVESLNNPTAVLVAADGRLFVAESGAGRILAVDADGNVSTLIEGFPLGTYTPFDIGPLSLATAADGTLIVGEGGNRAGRDRVSFYSTDGVRTAEPLTPVAGSDLFDVVVEPSSGNLYIAGTGSNRIYVAAPADTGGFEQATDFVTDTTADPIRAAAPSALAFDAQGRLLAGFADDAGGKIVALNTDAQAQSLLIETLVSEAAPIMSIAIRPSDNAIAYAEQDGPHSGSVVIIAPEGIASTFASGLAGPTDIVFAADDLMYAALMGDPPNGNAGQVVTIEVVDITTNGIEEEPDTAGPQA